MIFSCSKQSRMASAFSFLGLLLGAVHSLSLDEVPEGMVATPHGIRPSQCVHQVKSNDHKLHHEAGGVRVEYPTLGIEEFYPELPECVENVRQLQADAAAQNVSDNGGWEIYGGWTSPSLVGNFSVTYHLPSEDPTSNGGQILYYFIGFQPNDDPNNITIIQPVVAYCPSGCGWSYSPGWSMASWNCCPSGETWYGKGVKLETGATVEAYTYSTGSDAYVYEAYKGEASVLNIASDYRRFNWACVTGEFYDYSGCKDFNEQAFTFANMRITTLNGNQETPRWEVANNIEDCGASLKISG